MCHQTHRRALLLAVEGAYPRILANSRSLHLRLRDEALLPEAQAVAVSWGVVWAPAPSAPSPAGVVEREREVVMV